jgi:Ca2+-transporting ATPase
VEAAIATAAAGHGIDPDKLLGDRNVVGMQPFDSERKRMSVTVESADGRILFARGAPEKMIERLVDDADRSDLRDRSQRWAERGMRVLVVAKRELPADDDEDQSVQQ